MERLNWAVLGLMGIVTALGLATSSGEGKAQNELPDGTKITQVIECPPIGGVAPSSDNTPIELATSVPATSHEGCQACQAKKAREANEVAAAAPPSKKAQADFDGLINLVVTGLGDWKVNSEEQCPGNCHATGVCCDKTLSKNTPALTAKLEIHACEGECPLSKKSADVANLDQALAPRSGLVELYIPSAQSSDCPLAKAAEGGMNLIKNFVCEEDCLAGKGQGTLTITAVDPAAKPDVNSKPEGLLNLQAAAVAVQQVPANNSELSPEEQAKREANQAWLGSIMAHMPPEQLEKMPDAINSRYQNVPVTSTITINSATLDAAKTGNGTLTLNINATEQKPAAATTLAEQFKAAEAKPVIDNSRAAARAAKQAKIEAKLEAPWELAIEQLTVDELASAVQQKYSVPVIIDHKSLEEAAFDLGNTRLNVTKQQEIEAGEYLKGALNDLGLSWIIPASGDRVLITTRTAEESLQIKKVYDVTDLLTEENGTEELVNGIQSLVSPPTWKNNGGQGDLVIWKIDGGYKLVTSNSYWVQRELTDFMVDLRSSDAAGKKPAKLVPENKTSSWKRYPLPGLTDVGEAEQRQAQLTAHRQFLLVLCREIVGFDAANFEVANYGELLLVTKQTPAVHRQIAKQLQMVGPNHSGGGYQVQSPEFP